MRVAQVVAAQAARARTGGDLPNGDEAARLVAEFEARGGVVTVCPPADAVAEKDQPAAAEHKPDPA